MLAHEVDNEHMNKKKSKKCPEPSASLPEATDFKLCNSNSMATLVDLDGRVNIIDYMQYGSKLII